MKFGAGRLLLERRCSPVSDHHVRLVVPLHPCTLVWFVRFDEAETVFSELLGRNPENVRYHAGRQVR